MEIEKWQGTRSFYRRMDTNDDGKFDLYDSSGNPQQQYTGLSQSNFYSTVIRYRFTGKLTYNVNENHRISLGAFGNPTTTEGVGGLANPSNNLANILNGQDSTFYSSSASGGITASLSYDGKFLDKKLLVHSDLGYYNSSEYTKPFNEQGEVLNIAHRNGGTPNIGDYIPQIKDSCYGNDLPVGSKIIGKNACPSLDFETGGLGYYSNSLLQRVQGRLHFTGLFNALGSHQVKAGFEMQHVNMFESRGYTGGASLRDYGNGKYLELRRYGYYPAGTNVKSSDFDFTDESKVIYSNPYKSKVYYNNYALFAQDSWSIVDKVNVNGGVRVDIQDIYGGNAKGNYGARAMLLTNVSPRVGLIYDFTGTGRSKVFASYGRFYELVPLQMANRAFPQDPNTIRTRQCANANAEKNPLSCPILDSGYHQDTVLYNTPVAKNIQGQYTDMFQVGAEYQVLNDLLAGLSYTMSRLGNAIEDMSGDDGNTYFIGNPGVADGKYVQANDQLTYRPRNIRYPKPERRYDAVSVYLTKSLSQSKIGNLIGNISYTWSMLRGHYSGLFDPSTGQLDPNINADLDLASLLDNRYGLLGADRTHMFKIDASYVIAAHKRLMVIPNVSFRAGSGTPYSYLGSHEIYLSGSSYLIGRASAGRTEALLTFDAGVNMESALDNKGTKFSFGLTFANIQAIESKLGGHQRVVRVDENFTKTAARPIRGGDESDLAHLKGLGSLGQTSTEKVTLFPNFANATEYQTPFEMRINAKFTF